MSYRLYANKRNPIAFWNLDDTVPFQDQTGLGLVGDKKSGTSNPTTAAALVSGAAFSSVFNSGSVGKFANPLYISGLEEQPFVLEAWILPIPKTSVGNQQILSNGTIFDGLSINGKTIKFSTNYATSGEAACYYDLIWNRAAHIVGVHSNSKNELYVNGQLVASVELTDSQKLDSYASSDGFLYSGHTTSTAEIAMNGVAMYRTLSPEDIFANYAAGIRSVPQDSIAIQNGGITFDMSASIGSVYIDQNWATRSDFNLGYNQNVIYSDTQIVPKNLTGVSEAGSWTIGVPLDDPQGTSIYGAAASWSATGVTVSASLDGTTWTSISNGRLMSIIPNGFDPTNKDLQIRFSFAGGIVDDTSFIDSVNLTVFRNNDVVNSQERAITVSYPAILRSNYEPIYYRDDNGIYLDGGTLTIGTESTTDALVPRTLELWIKVISGTPTISVSGTTYVNGSAGSSLPVGEWRLMHIVSASDITTNITITGDCIIGQATLYKNPLTAPDVSYIYSAYTGVPVLSFIDTSAITVSEPATPHSLYDHDWSIDGAG